MTSVNNVAGRLLEVLTKIKLESKTEGQPARGVWCRILRVDPADTPRFLNRFAKVLLLPNAVAREVRAIPEAKHEAYLAWMPKVTRAFGSLNLDAAFQAFSSPIDETVTALLSVCDDQLSRLRPERAVDEPNLEELRGTVLNLTADVKKADIEEWLRDYLLRHLMLIEQAILDYDLQGIESLQAGLEASLGHAMCRRDAHEAAKENFLGKRVFQIIGKYVLIVTAATGSRELAGDILKLLPGPSDTSVAADENSSEVHTLPSETDALAHRNANAVTP